jgi:hypothetical protein
MLVRSYLLLGLMLWQFIFFSSASANTPVSTKRFAVLGDDFALGLLAGPLREPDLSVYFASLAELHSAPWAPFDSGVPTVLWPTSRENTRGGRDWAISNLSKGLATSTFDWPQKSWGYFVGRSQGISPENIFIAAEHGARVGFLPREFDRLLRVNPTLPEFLVISFAAGHDVCATDFDGMLKAQEYGDALFKGVTYALRHGKLPEGGIHIALPHVPNLTSWLTRPSILEQSVRYLGETMSCQTARKQNFQPAKSDSLLNMPQDLVLLSSIFPANPVSSCPTLFAHSLLARRSISFFSQFNPKERTKELAHLENEFLSTVADRLRRYRQETDKAVERVREWAAAHAMADKVFIKALPQTAALEFEGQDLGTDCWQLNQNGQAKLGQSIAEAWFSSPNI